MKHNYPATRGAPPPADFAEHAAREPNTTLAKRYGTSPDIAARWRRESGIALPRRISKPRPLSSAPADFGAVAPGMTVMALCRHYRRARPTILRWCADAGIEPVPYVRPTFAQPRPRLAAVSQSASGRVFTPFDRPNRDCSRAGQAADFLRRFGSVYRCDADGQLCASGGFWCRGGRVVLTDAELIERAERNGWRPDAWREVRAA